MQMELPAPSLKILFSLEDVKELIKKTLHKKNWHKFKHGDVTLSFIPYYTFYYDAYFEKNEEGIKKISKTKRGQLALNTISAELDNDVPGKELQTSEKTKETPKFPIKIKEALMTEEEAKKIAAIKTAEMLGIHFENIMISRIKMIYYPEWVLGIEVAEGNFELKVSAITGKIFGEEKIPERLKGLMEITTETLYELKNPIAWGKYAIETGKTITKNKTLRAILKNKWLIIAILVIILIYVIFFLQVKRTP